MKLRYLMSLLAASAMVIQLAGCGSTESSTSDNVASGESAATQESSASLAEVDLREDKKSPMPEADNIAIYDGDFESFLSDLAHTTDFRTDVQGKIAKAEVAEKAEYSIGSVNCEPIDKTLDCDKILLEKAEALKTLSADYFIKGDYGISGYTADTDSIVVDEFNNIVAVRAVSEKNFCYSDWNGSFSDDIYSEYLNVLNAEYFMLFDVDGVLYSGRYSNELCAPFGTLDTWYLGCDVSNNSIVGHFAQLDGTGEPEEVTAEYLNDENNYSFYDIIVQCVDGKYVITSCYETVSGKNYDMAITHGCYYNSCNSGRGLVTNERLAPYSVD